MNVVVVELAIRCGQRDCARCCGQLMCRRVARIAGGKVVSRSSGMRGCLGVTRGGNHYAMGAGKPFIGVIIIVIG